MFVDGKMYELKDMRTNKLMSRAMQDDKILETNKGKIVEVNHNNNKLLIINIINYSYTEIKMYR